MERETVVSRSISYLHPATPVEALHELAPDCNKFLIFLLKSLIVGSADRGYPAH